MTYWTVYYLLAFIFGAGMTVLFFSNRNKVMTSQLSEDKPCRLAADQLQINADQKSETVLVTFKGHCYDITDFLKRHPGGKEVLLENNGKDIEKIMGENEHSQHAYNLLEGYRLP